MKVSPETSFTDRALVNSWVLISESRHYCEKTQGIIP